MLRIINGEVYDPQNGITGEVRDIWVEDGKIVAGPRVGAGEGSVDAGRASKAGAKASAGTGAKAAQVGSSGPTEVETLDASGLVIMPGGVEIHSHMAGPKVNSGRLMCPEDHYRHFRPRTANSRSGAGYTTPSTFFTGYLYATMGYTTAMEAAAPPLEARHVHEELADTPLLDSGLFTLMGNNYLVMKVLADADAHRQKDRLREVVAWLLKSSRGYAIKVVNPGGVENWKWKKGAVDLDTQVPPLGITPRQILVRLVETAEALKLPHPVHLHANQIGHPGNFATTLETMRTVEGHRLHLTHMQFHAYGATKKGSFRSAAPQIAQYLNQHPEFTCDVGQIVFGPATTMTADSPLQFSLHRLTGNKWGNCDVEMETGSGVVPMVYRPGSLPNAVQWAIGLELFLLIENPWQVFLTTDHPNAGPFTAYPHIIKLLMDRDCREQELAQLHPKAQRYIHLAELKREYSLEEIAIITRAGPARALGLTHKGHLGVGADADIAIYRPQKDIETMFAQPAYVFKEGKLIAREGQILASYPGRTLAVDPPGPGRLPADLEQDFQQFYTVSLANYAVEDEYVPRLEVIPCA